MDTITWLFTVKPETANIQTFEDNERSYEEVAIIEVQLKTDKKVNQIGEIVQKSIPYPLLLFLVNDSKVIVCVALKRVNQADKSKLVIAELAHSEPIDLEDTEAIHKSFVDNFKAQKWSFNNLYDFYSDIYRAVIGLNCSVQTGEFVEVPVNLVADRSSLLDKLTALNAEKNSLLTEIKAETQFNRKLELNIKIKDIEAEIERLQEKLRGS